jgi:hypothetical protein
MLVVITWLALMIALVGEFSYGTTVDAAQAANARDELRAHYMARSSVNLSRLLIKIQQKFVEPVMGQAQKMMKDLMGGAAGTAAGANPLASMGISLRITDYAGMLMGFFAGSQEEAQALGTLIGLNLADAKGLGLKSGRFDAEILPEDGKIDLNCGTEQTGNVEDITRKQRTVFRLLAGLTHSVRYDRLFSEQDSRSQFSSRLDVARALIDWADPNEQLYSPDGPSGGAEDYRYDATEDKYRAHDNRYDSLEEIKQVRGVTDAFYEAFAPYLTVYKGGDPTPNCRINLGAITNKVGGDCTPVIMGVIRAAAIADPTKAATVDPAILDDTKLYPLATILCDRASASGFDSLDTVMTVLTKPESAVLTDDPRYRVLQGMQQLRITRADLDAVAYVGAPRTYRIVATGESGKVKRKITAIVESGRALDHPLTMNIASEVAAGVLQYWREE